MTSKEAIGGAMFVILSVYEKFTKHYSVGLEYKLDSPATRGLLMLEDFFPVNLVK